MSEIEVFERFASLERRNFTGQSLSGYDLTGASLRYTILRDTDLSCTTFKIADLFYADLRMANLKGADLSGANLKGADLRGADLRGAKLKDANFEDAKMEAATLGILNNLHNISFFTNFFFYIFVIPSILLISILALSSYLRYKGGDKQGLPVNKCNSAETYNIESNR